MIEAFSIGILIIILADFFVSAALAAESAASVFSAGFTQDHSEPVISLRKGADETVYALHVMRSLLHFFLAAVIVGWLLTLNVNVWWAVALTALAGGALVSLLEVLTSAVVSRRPYAWLARLQPVSRVADFLFHPVAVFARSIKSGDRSG